MRFTVSVSARGKFCLGDYQGFGPIIKVHLIWRNAIMPTKSVTCSPVRICKLLGLIAQIQVLELGTVCGLCKVGVRVTRPSSNNFAGSEVGAYWFLFFEVFCQTILEVVQLDNNSIRRYFQANYNTHNKCSVLYFINIVTSYKIPNNTGHFLKTAAYSLRL